MTTPDGFDRVLTSWLEEQAPMREPDDLLRGVEDKLARTRRLPGWVLLERWIPMQTQAKLGAIPRSAIILAVLAALAALLTAIAVGANLPRPAPLFGLAHNGSVYSVRDGDIYRSTPDGSPEPFVISPQQEIGPTVTNDGTRVVFERKDGERSTFMVVDASGGVPKPLIGTTFTSISDWWPSPDGRYLAVVAPDGAQDNLTIIPTDGVLPAYTPHLGRSAKGAAFEPDSRTLLVHVYHVGSEGPGSDLYRMPADGSAEPVLVSSQPGGWRWSNISPDGKQIAFATYQEPCCATSLLKAWIMDRDGTHARRLTDTPDDIWEDGTFWSPDGSLVAITTGTGSTMHLAFLDPSGKQKTVLSDPFDLGTPIVATTTDLPVIFVTWAPDGRSARVWRSSAPGIVSVDTTTGTVETLPWSSEDWVSWQRLAG